MSAELVSIGTHPELRDADALLRFCRQNPRLFVLTGAGCSAASGIPPYRDATGAWQHRPPVQYAEFVASEAARCRYWARSLLGWPRIAQARPNGAHAALSRLEAAGHVQALVTQNVDGLHQRAGSRRVIDLHGRLDGVVCIACGHWLARADIQLLLLSWNPALATAASAAAPDGDAQLPGEAFELRLPSCPACAGVLKPDVVFFGENVPRTRVDAALRALSVADAVLVVGSSLTVYSGFRFCLAARAMGKPIAAVNLGRTRADAMLDLKLQEDCAPTLDRLTTALDGAGRNQNQDHGEG